MGKVRFRFGPMVHGVILSSAPFLISCISTLGHLPGDQESCGRVDLLSLAWPKGECQQSKSPISTSTIYSSPSGQLEPSPSGRGVLGVKTCLACSSLAQAFHSSMIILSHVPLGQFHVISYGFSHKKMDRKLWAGCLTLT